MQDEFVGSFIAFKGDDELCSETNVLLEITEVEGQQVELAMNAPIPGKPRIYIKFTLAELIAHCMPEKK